MIRAPAEDSDRECWIDGVRVEPERAHLPVADPVVEWGLGLFETLGVRSGRALDLDEHLDRLAGGAVRLRVPLPPLERLRAVVEEAARSNERAVGWVKIVVSRSGRWFVRAGPVDPAEIDRPVTAIVLPWMRSVHDALAGLKSLNYAPNVLGLELARGRGAEEGLWRNDRGHLLEGCRSNLFVVRHGALYTPAERDGILAGVVRGMVLRVARDYGIRIHVGKLRLPRLQRAGEAFLTSSVRGTRPLVQVDGRRIGSGMPGPVTRRIATGVEEVRGIRRPT